ncbi:hypothetical protein UN679_08035 [Streptococcus suis]|uniref:hypothetical protein n=2 Tax=Streptococcus suis TaxID=1307 RepID=UPI001556DF6F|nr:hypothetical protein [Streptococcus suis]MDY7593389.1 hypothetical protein [Streptococcus suis]MDY7594207.1 hypothetical protein [Streptococcus suis]NQQ27938.1 hypothetical protein [Streptococcus suis]WNF58965.1 hypothetical protein RJW50_06825 [Streptococcus suis]HEM4550868.1 hypothetical protein [Streptococcus suis]
MMKVVANQLFLDAFEWDGSEETFEKIKELAANIKDDVCMRDGQLVVYDHAFEEEEVVDVGRYVVFESSRIDVYAPIVFETLYTEVNND